ncbi:hypothetical protein EMQU_0501 [Enterococcus mundtii QU 25]|nr:hypothetical protein EMQU_0501 [Enterococcus mundtii QU 25]BDP92853.1 hypothetical protein EfmGK923_30260 [Enterococcus faecium]BDP96045.1 hypothetical protein EfmGK941_30500 [Enterococcus faecium]BDP99232.1 hypothetical protein EfmGK961_30480 [Enterococcus faecium]
MYLARTIYCDKGRDLRFSKNRRHEQPCNVIGIGKSQVQSEHLKVYVRIESLERGKLVTWRTNLL